MEKFWVKAVSVTGPVAVVGFLFVIFINKIFEEKVIEYFGSETSFYLIFGVLCVLGSALMLSILVYHSKHSKRELKNERDSGGESKTTNITNSKIDGDIVFGNKTINQDRKRGK